jgi:hypothetical protein
VEQKCCAQSKYVFFLAEPERVAVLTSSGAGLVGEAHVLVVVAGLVVTGFAFHRQMVVNRALEHTMSTLRINRLTISLHIILFEP